MFNILHDFLNEVTGGVIFIDDYVGLGDECNWDYGAAVGGVSPALVMLDVEEIDEGGADAEARSDLVDGWVVQLVLHGHAYYIMEVKQLRTIISWS